LERQRSRSPSVAIAALTVAALLWNPSSVQADFLAQINADVAFQASLFNVDRRDSAPFSVSASKLLPLGISGTASAFAGLGPLRVSFEVDNSFPTPTLNGGPLVDGFAHAQYTDDFSASLPGPRGRQGTLVFTFALRGDVSAGGIDELELNASRAFASAGFSVS